MDKQFKPVIKAAYRGDFALFKSLLRHNPELIVMTSNDPGDSPNLIQFIVVEGGLGKIPDAATFLTHLLENGSTTKKQLVAAASVNARELVDVLISSGVPLTDGAPWTAIEESLYWKHQDMAAYLLNEHGAKINSLCAAAMLGNAEATERFFDENGKLSSALLPIHFPWGAIQDSVEQDAIDQAFILALRNKKYNTPALLLKRGANINAIPPGNHEECTALHQAVYLNDIDMVDWLIDRDATGNIKDPRYKADAIEWARHFENTALENHLKKRLKK
ncbi:MAG: ankyrin repeat domain-containing protein [Calditrichia bacterium]